ncbi:MAG: SPFH domain-containing protein [Bacteroidota bacterium]|jgi:flotillin|nr:SPFH domain-containing protein [Bacteroidota bacterium]NLS99208.1 flotillin family protein [Bacteroidales bacterium]HNU77386.1 SPFH domain-containing protein [Prolixibacteraceae bacterium]HNZ68034.1 SPFH domain-containing protein [Prolixibacteraceae bacterium]HOC85988.1 SPFH domain-containing protein [Prolixibacteraceae bacterium]
MGEYVIFIVAVAVFFIFILIVSFFRRYKRCPSDRILVVYGKVGKGGDAESRSAKCIHGGAAFIWPVIQDYSFLDLTPFSIEINLTSALSKQNIRVDVPSRFTVGISTEEGVMTNAAERLLGLSITDISNLAKDIIFGQLRLVVATMDIEEINSNRDKFLAAVSSNVEAELKKIGLKLINVNVTDITDESGYIEALGKEAAAKAINDAKISVSQKNRDGSIGEAEALKEQRVEVARANATAVEGENTAKITIANSNADRRQKEAEAERLAVAAEKVAQAKALEEAYAAEKAAETVRAVRDKASQQADIIVPAEIDKTRIEIAAEAIAEQTRRQAKGEADAIFMKMEAEGKGIFEILSKQAEGYQKLMKAAGDDSRSAVMLMIADKLPELVKTQVEAIKNLKIDKITVWDTMGSGKDGKSPATANFLSGMLGSIPPFEELFKMAGLELPDYLKGKKAEDSEVVDPDKPKTQRHRD